MNVLNDYLLLIVSLLLIAMVVNMMIIVRKKNDNIMQLENDLENLYYEYEELENRTLSRDVGETTAQDYSDDIMALIHALELEAA